MTSSASAFMVAKSLFSLLAVNTTKFVGEPLPLVMFQERHWHVWITGVRSREIILASGTQ
jgi:hypothetical protein